MSVDIYHSRRTNYKKVLFYNRDERVSVGDMGKWVLQQTPNGTFYAKEVNAETFSHQQISNAFMFDNNTTVLETNDNISNMQVGCVVFYLGKVWFVENIQASKHIKATEFSNKQEATYFIAIRR